MLPKTLSRIVIVFATALVTAQHVQKPLTKSPSTPFTPEFDALVQESLNHFHVPGLSIAVIDGNQTYAKGYGIAEFPSQAATPSTLYYTGSTTKSFTAAALTLLIDDTANSTTPLQWTTPISNLLRSDFVLASTYATTHTTLEDAASHRTGMPRHDSSYGPPFTPKDLVRNLRNLPLTAPIRTRWQYCNMMFIVLSHVIETLTGIWLGDFLRLRIWEPLGMSSTYFALEDAKKAVATEGKVLSRGYFWQNSTQRYIPEDYLDDGALISGAGAVISNVLDYAKYLGAMIEQAPPISPAGHRALRTPRAFVDPVEEIPNTGPLSYALGWELSTYQGVTMLYHGGALPGFGTQMLYLPWRKWGLAIMANTLETSNEVALVLQYALLDELLGTPENEKVDWRKKMDEMEEEARRREGNARERLYPEVPEQPIPLSLPLEKYTGMYESPGYGKLNITLADGGKNLGSKSGMGRVLTGNLLRGSGVATELEHVSGEFFMVHAFYIHTDGSKDLAMTVKAEWKVGAAGNADAVGVDIEPEMGGEKIWFQRVK